MSAADAFVAFRHSSLEKRAFSLGDALGAAGQYIADNPWAQGAIGGGIAGGLTGLIPGQKVLRNALIGAGLGGAAGGAYQWLNRGSGYGDPNYRKLGLTEEELQALEQASTPARFSGQLPEDKMGLPEFKDPGAVSFLPPPVPENVTRSPFKQDAASADELFRELRRQNEWSTTN